MHPDVCYSTREVGEKAPEHRTQAGGEPGRLWKEVSLGRLYSGEERLSREGTSRSKSPVVQTAVCKGGWERGAPWATPCHHPKVQELCLWNLCVLVAETKGCFLNWGLNPVSPAAPVRPHAGRRLNNVPLPQSPPRVSESAWNGAFGDILRVANFSDKVSCPLRREHVRHPRTHVLWPPHGHSPPVLLLSPSQSPGVRQRGPQTLGSEQGTRKQAGHRLSETICFPSVSRNLI